MAGRRLWEQIAGRIEDPELDGWAILLTQASISSAACQEELAYALERALNTKGEAFPLLGLVDNVPIAELPASLRTRLMVKLRDPEWPELVVSALSGVAGGRRRRPATRYRWESIADFRSSGSVALWIRPRFEEIAQWMIAYPPSARRIDWGPGLPQGGGYTGTIIRPAKGTGNLRRQAEEEPIEYVGAGVPATPASGCYVVFEAPLPKFVAFAAVDPLSGEIDARTVEVFELDPTRG